MIFDKQYAFSIIVILLGFGLLQTGSDDNSFLIGAGVGTIAIGMFWILMRIFNEFKNPKSRTRK